MGKYEIIELKPGHPIYRMLIVGDIDDDRNVLHTLFEHIGFETRHAMNGTRAFEWIVKWQPHLIWMNMKMPGSMDGLETTGKIRAAFGYEIKIVGLSAGVLEKEYERALAAGCDDFLHIPFEKEEVFQVLCGQLGLRYDSKKPNLEAIPMLGSAKIGHGHVAPC